MPKKNAYRCGEPCVHVTANQVVSSWEVRLNLEWTKQKVYMEGRLYSLCSNPNPIKGSFNMFILYS